MNRARNFIKITATAMVLILLLALAPVGALTPGARAAASYVVRLNQPGTNTVAGIQTAIQDAIDNADDTVTVEGAFDGATDTLNLDIPVGKSVIWKAAYSSYNYVGTGGLIKFTGDGDFVVTDGGGFLLMGPYSGSVIYAANRGNIIIENGEVNNYGFGGYYGIYTNGGSIIIKNGTVIVSGSSVPISASGVEISGGTVIAVGGSGICAWSGNVSISGENTAVYADGGIHSAEGNIDISGGVVDAQDKISGITAKGNINITGSKLTVSATDVYSHPKWVDQIIGGYAPPLMLLVAPAPPPIVQGIYADKNIAISGGAVTVNSRDDGIVAKGDIIISGDNTVVTAMGAEEYGILGVNGDITISGGAVTASGATAAICVAPAGSLSPDMSVTAAKYTYSYSTNQNGTGATTKTYPADGAFVNSLNYKWVKIAAASGGGGGGGGTNYAVTFNTNGGSAVAGQSVASGDNAAKPADPTKAGYNFAGWYKDAALTQAYDFGAAVTADITLYAKWTEKDAIWDNPFTDVKESDWFYGDVQYVLENGLMNGTGENKFSPDDSLTRGMMVTILYRAAGSPDVSGLANPFSDVAAGQYYTDAVKWAAANGIVTGYGDGRFGTNDNITRQDLAVIFLRYAEFSGAKLPELRVYPGFGDEAFIAGYARAAVEALYRAEIINGKGNNRFDPQGTATRAEAAAMLHRFFAIDS